MSTKPLCHTKVKTLDEYFKLDDTIVYVRDLKHQAPDLINAAVAQGIKIYSALAKRKTAKQKWIKTTTYGIGCPTTIRIEFSNGCVLLDYSLFDKDEFVMEEEMAKLTSILDSYGNRMTGCQIIKSLLRPGIANIPDLLHDIEKDNYFMLKDAFRGGANNVMIYDPIAYETHIDYHQLYAAVMITHNFPWLQPKEADGYFPHEFGIYMIASGRARVKKDGYALLPRMFGDKMAGADGNWFDLAETLGCICDPDLKLLYENYEVEDMGISYTIYYPNSFSGEKEFSPVVSDIYKGRKTTEGAVKRFYKLMNEYLAGFFERTYSKGTWWTTMDQPVNLKAEKTKHNPIVGMFITAYGRQKLDALLHMLPHDKVAGYDTDCAFFCGKPEEVPARVMKLFGDGIGELHFDGIYKDVVHRASKSYYGWDIEKNAPFKKQSGASKSGKRWYWDVKKHIYYIKEVEKNEER